MSKKLKITIISLAVVLAVGIGAFAAGNYGTKDDPLITKSYLDSVVKPELQNQLQFALNEAMSEARGGNGEFTVVTLNKGQSLSCGVGTEILPRVGTVKASGESAPALIDTTTGYSVSSGNALSANHLYMVSIQGNGIKADSDGVKVLVSGTYSMK